MQQAPNWQVKGFVQALMLSVMAGAACQVSAQNVGAPVSVAPTASTALSFASQLAGFKKHTGFFDVYTHHDQGKLYLAVPEQQGSFILFSSLPQALGSNDIGLDRGQAGASKLVHFERHGKRLFLIQENTKFIATSESKDESASVREAFAGAVLWAGDILANENQQYLIDFSSFLLSDRHGDRKSVV